jgi:hypothetical protein
VTPTLQKIQPMALRGWREAMMAPTTEKASARTDSVIEPSGTVDRVIRANEIPPTSSTTDTTTSDQASQAAARPLIPPTLRSCPPVRCVMTPL